MEGDYIEIHHWLKPLSWLYGLGVGLRNWLFDAGILKEHSFSLPVISVGNLTVGGCGKTPMVEYIVNLLKKQYRVTVLSRGYKRRSKGFQVADEHTVMTDIGDEPMQMWQKFGKDIHVAVDKDRVHGINQIMAGEQTKDTEAVILDDAYQHRYVKPGVNILLVDYHRLIIYDCLLPAGRLREPCHGKNRADIVIVTKCPDTLKPMDYRVLTKAMHLRPYQHLYFTNIKYGNLVTMNGEKERTMDSLMADENVLLLTGIASPKQIEDDLAPFCRNITPLTYPDHYQFEEKDLEEINSAFSSMKHPKMVITTEKDASRLKGMEGLSEEVRENLYVLPITVGFKLDKEEEFCKKIMSYVEKTLAMYHMKPLTPNPSPVMGKGVKS